MNLNFSQSTGKVTEDDGTLVATGFAGNDSRPGVNPNHAHGYLNPAAEYLHNIGPLPKGTYSVGAWGSHPPLGAHSAPLTQTSGQTFGRKGFFIHGPSLDDPLNSSEGCIVISHLQRLAVEALAPSQITVTG
jgi:hypothetical protein